MRMPEKSRTRQPEREVREAGVMESDGPTYGHPSPQVLEQCKVLGKALAKEVVH